MGVSVTDIFVTVILERQKSILETHSEEQQLLELHTHSWQMVFLPFYPGFQASIICFFFTIVSIIYVSGYEQIYRNFIHKILDLLAELVFYGYCIV
jgi:hypothetical protein